MATAVDTGCAPQVAPWVKPPACGESKSRSTSPERTSTPPMGAYPDVAPLAKVNRSGTTPYLALPNHSPSRPYAQITSSATSKMPYRSQIDRSCCQ